LASGGDVDTMTFVSDVDDADDDGPMPFTVIEGKVPGNGRI